MKLLPVFFFSSYASSFAVVPHNFRSHTKNSWPLFMAKVGIFFGTSTGSTETVADLIAERLGDDADGPFDVDSHPIADIGKYSSVVVGTPTWNTGADTQRSGTGWDELHAELEKLDLKGKNVAVFGLGDQVSYTENYADATGELHDIFENLGCKMFGYTSQEGYEHEDSKSIRGDKFCGLLCDMVNQEDQTELRVENWVAQLHDEGFLDGERSSGASSVVSAPSAEESVETTSKDPAMDELIAKLERENAELRKKLEDQSTLLDQNIVSHDTGYTPHYNSVSGRTMWTSSDGRTCYYTSETVQRASSAKMAP